MSTSTVFTFKLESAPTAYTPVRYDQIGGEYYVTVSYDRQLYNKKYPIHQIIINHPLDTETPVPTAPNRALITSQSLQIPFSQYEVNCTPSPAMSVGEEAILTVTNLIQSEDATCLRSETITLTIGTKTYTITPTTFSENRIAKATCSQSGGRRKRRAFTRRRTLKKKTRRSF